MSKESKQSKRGESLARRQSRSIHEKHRRIHMNDVLSEMTQLTPERFFEAESSSSHDKIARRPNKCGVISAAVHYLREATKQDDKLNLTTLQHSRRLLSPVILALRGWIVEQITGPTEGLFLGTTTNMVGKDIRQYLSEQSASVLMARSLFSWPQKIEYGTIFRTSIQKRFSCSNAILKENGTICIVLVPEESKEEDNMPDSKSDATPTCNSVKTSKVADRPLLAALLMRPDTVKPVKEAKYESPLDSSDNRTITPALHCESPSTSFLSPESASSIGSAPKSIRVPTLSDEKKTQKSTKTPSVKKQGSRKRLKSVNAIVESYSLDNPEKPSEMNGSITNQLAKNTSIAINPYEALSPAYREIWLHLQSQRLMLEEQVKAKERELQSLMLSTFTYPVQTSGINPLVQIPTAETAWHLLPRQDHGI